VDYAAIASRIAAMAATCRHTMGLNPIPSPILIAHTDHHLSFYGSKLDTFTAKSYRQ
jgi:hypothetical protein